MKRNIFTSISLLFALCSCGQQTQTINADEFEKQIIATKSEQLIDVRTPQEFAENRIKDAQNIDFRSPNFRKEIEKLDKTKPVLIYCQSGVRSGNALAVFQKAGFNIVYNLNGGINAWAKAGKTVE